jgi:hypothetical protein
MLTVEHRSLGANLSRCLRGSGVASGSPPTAAADAAISHNRLLIATGAHPSRLPPRTPIPRASRSLYLRLIDGGICRSEAVASTREWISLRPRVHYLQGGLNNTATAGAHQTGAPIYGIYLGTSGLAEELKPFFRLPGIEPDGCLHVDDEFRAKIRRLADEWLRGEWPTTSPGT